MEKTGAAKSVAKKVTQLIGKKRAVLGVLIAAAVLNLWWRKLIRSCICNLSDCA